MSLPVSVNYGTSAGDGTGEPTRTAFQKLVTALNGITAADIAYTPTGGVPQTSATALNTLNSLTAFAVNQTVNLYVNPTGSDTNTGASTAPFATLQKALDTVGQYPALNGLWKINLAAGNYASASVPIFLLGRNRVQILGPAVSGGVPTAIINSGTVGLTLNAAANVYIQDVKFSGLPTAISAQDGCDLYCSNVHLFDCPGGIVMNYGVLRFAGGIIDGNNNGASIGVTAVTGAKFTIGYAATSLATGTTIQNCNQGVLATELSSGHTDYCTFTNNTVAVCVDLQSRAHVNTCTFNVGASQIGVRPRYNSSWYNNTNTFVLSGGGIAWESFGGSLEVNNAAAAVVERRSYYNSSVSALTGSSTLTTLVTATAIVPKMSFYWSGRRLRIRFTGTLTGTAGNKTMQFRLTGGFLFSMTIPAAQTGAFVGEVTINALASNSQRYAGRIDVNGSSPIVVSGTSAVSLLDSTDYDVVIQAQNASTADTLALGDVEIWETA